MKKLILLIVVSFALNAKAQQDYIVSQVNFDNGLYNPSAIGQNERFNATLLYRRQWVDFDGAPQTGMFHIKTPLANKKFGLGVFAAYDRIGFMERSDFFLSYAYHAKLGDHSKLSFGLRAGMNHLKVVNSAHVYWDKEDDLLTNNYARVQPNFGFGMSYMYKDLYLGFAIPGLLNYRPNSALSVNGVFQLERHYHLQGTYKFKLGEEYKLQPGFYLRYVNNAPIQADFNLMVIYHDYLQFGGGYRTGDALFLGISLQFIDRMAIGYAYDITLTNLRTVSAGSHEIALRLGLWSKTKEHVPSLMDDISKNSNH